MTDIIITEETLEQLEQCKIIHDTFPKMYQIALYRSVVLRLKVGNAGVYMDIMEIIDGDMEDRISLHNPHFDGNLMMSKLFKLYECLTGKALTAIDLESV